MEPSPGNFFILERKYPMTYDEDILNLILKSLEASIIIVDRRHDGSVRVRVEKVNPLNGITAFYWEECLNKDTFSPKDFIMRAKDALEVKFAEQMRADMIAQQTSLNESGDEE